jgi:hypothetical protein
MIAEIEQNYSFASQIIPSCKEVKKMIKCPAFSDYVESTYKLMQPDHLYKANWIHKNETQKEFILDSSMMTAGYKAQELGPLVQSPDQQAQAVKEAPVNMSHRTATVPIRYLESEEKGKEEEEEDQVKNLKLEENNIFLKVI